MMQIIITSIIVKNWSQKTKAEKLLQRNDFSAFAVNSDYSHSVLVNSTYTVL